MKIDMQKFDGGRNVMAGAGALGALGLLATFAGMATSDGRTAAFSYLFGFAYWGGIALASVVLLQIFHAVRAKWMVVLRRPVEVMATTITLFIVLFIPIVLALKNIYSWVEPAADLPKEALKLLEHKKPWLNPNFFVVRSFGYLLLATLVSNRLLGWSTKQDTTGDIQLTARQRAFGAGSLPFVALTFSFAGFDWLMSLQPLWFSTIFGVYYFAGSFVSAIALLIVVTDRARGKNLYGDYVSPDHIHNLGKLMLAFTCFWAYIGFSQFLLIWIAGLPEEVPFFITRMHGEWAAVSVFLIFGHFFIPFGLLLSRARKRSSSRLALVAFWILLVHSVDLYWLIMPSLNPDGLVLHWSLVTAFVGVGGLSIAFAIWRLRGHFSMPVRDPYLAESVAYKQPSTQ
ncbi:MAG TPA: hypothetical protein VGP07_03505 [Polyangia bacterium]|jgi:hypothetical protein